MKSTKDDKAIAALDHVGGAASYLDRFGRWLERLPLVWFTVLTFVLAVVRIGPYFNHDFNAELMWEPSLRPPFPTILLNSSLTITSVLHIPTRPIYEALSVLFLLGIVTLTALIASRTLAPLAQRLLLAAILLGPIGGMLIGFFGRSDSILILGAILFVFYAPRNPVIAVATSAVMAFANVGQSFVGALAAVLIGLTTIGARWRIPTFIFLAVSISWMAVATVIGDGGGTDTQTDYFTRFFPGALIAFTQFAPAMIYSIYGAMWLLVLLALSAGSVRDRILIALSLIAAPIGVMAVTIDGTRDGVGVTFVPFLIVAVVLLPQVATYCTKGAGRAAFGALILIALVMPAIDVGHDTMRQPWEWTMHEVAFWYQVFGSPLG